MSNNNKIFEKVVDIKNIKSSNTIPTNWKKFGEVYFNELEQPIFICLVCFKKTDSITAAFNTNDGSAFLWHIQQQHINEECETIDQISEEIRKFETNVNELNDSNEKNDSRNTNTTNLSVSMLIY